MSDLNICAIETVWTSRQIFRFCAWLLSSLFGAPASWVDRTLNHMAAAFTIRPLLTRLADVLEGRAGTAEGRLTSWHRHLRRRGRPRSRAVRAAARAAWTRGGAPDASRSPAGPSTSPGTCRHLLQHRRQKQVVASAGRGGAAVSPRCSRVLSSLGPGQRAARGFGYGFPRIAAGPAVLPAPGFRATGRSRPFPDSAGRCISEMSLDLGLPGAAHPFQQKIR